MQVDDLSGTRLGGYLIEGRVGHGGMAFVYRATQTRLNRRCALKILRPELAEDERFVHRFLQEAQSAANLNHPNIVTIYDTGEINGFNYIAMEYLTGRPLQDLMAEGQLDLASVVDIVSQAASALDYAHSQGVIHRDIKPGNMIMSDSGRLTLTDFGIARLSGSTRLTTTGTMLGTPVYMAPEQIQGEPATAQTDIYQLGITVYEMLAGKPPFQGETPQAVFYGHFQEAPAPLHETVKSLSPEVDAVINRALKKVPAERYRTATDMAVDLAKAIELSDPSIQLGDQATTPARQTPTGPEVTPARLAVADAAELTTRPDTSVGSRKRWAWVGGGVLALAILVAAAAGGFFLLRDGDSSSGSVATAPPAEAEIPALGGVIFEQDFENWTDEEQPEGSWTTINSDGSFSIGTDLEDHSITERSTGGVIIDGAVSTEVHMAEWAEGDHQGCLLARADTSNAFRYTYSLCINGNDETFAMYEQFDEDGNLTATVTLVPADRRLGTQPAEEWNQLEIITMQNQLWFLVNGQVIGSATHDADEAGVIGVALHNDTGTPAIFTFRSLLIRELA